MPRSNNGFGQLGTAPSPESIPNKPKSSPLAKYVHSGVITEVPNLVEEKLSDKALDRGLKRCAHRTDTREEEDSTTIMKEMVAYLKEKTTCYSRHDKRWVPWRMWKRAPLDEQLQKLQKEEEDEHMPEKHEVERLVHPEQDQPDGELACERANQSDQPERIAQQVQISMHSQYPGIHPVLLLIGTCNQSITLIKARGVVRKYLPNCRPSKCFF